MKKRGEEPAFTIKSVARETEKKKKKGGRGGKRGACFHQDERGGKGSSRLTTIPNSWGNQGAKKKRGRRLLQGLAGKKK